MSSNILSTPASIHEFLSQNYPSATLELKKLEPVELELKLEGIETPIALNQAVSQVAFEQFLSQTQTSGFFNPLDTSQFFINSPLLDGQKFKRVLYEQEGKGGSQAIRDLYSPVFQNRELALVMHELSHVERKWPNIQTLFTVITVLNSIACIAFPTPYLLITNVAMRSLSIFVSVYCNQKTKIAFDVFGIVLVLAVPYGSAAAIAGDLVFEGINFARCPVMLAKVKVFFNLLFNRFISPSKNTIPLPTRLDPSVPENAYKILNISIDNRDNSELINQQYRILLDKLEMRKSNVSPCFADAIQLLVDDLNQAYQTLTDGGPLKY